MLALNILKKPSCVALFLFTGSALVVSGNAFAQMEINPYPLLKIEAPAQESETPVTESKISVEEVVVADEASDAGLQKALTNLARARAQNRVLAEKAEVLKLEKQTLMKEVEDIKNGAAVSSQEEISAYEEKLKSYKAQEQELQQAMAFLGEAQAQNKKLGEQAEALVLEKQALLQEIENLKKDTDALSHEEEIKSEEAERRPQLEKVLTNLAQARAQNKALTEKTEALNQEKQALRRENEAVKSRIAVLRTENVKLPDENLLKAPRIAPEEDAVPLVLAMDRDVKAEVGQDVATDEEKAGFKVVNDDAPLRPVLSEDSSPPDEGLLMASASDVEPSAYMYEQTPVIVDEPLRQEWEVSPGENMHKTLAEWSEAADVELVWNSYNDGFDVLEAIRMEGSFESAVQALLDQYEGEDVRPVGQLYRDNKNGKKTLLIEVLREG